MTIVPLRRRPGADTLAIQAVVARLHDLHDGPLALPEIISLGSAAVPALEAFLRGPSQSLHHQRALAADALGTIGGNEATAALLRALHDCSTRALDPLPLQAEDVVVSRIAEQLSRRIDAQVVDGLLDALRQRPYPACVSALGRAGDERAIDLLVACLHEDAARAATTEALRHFGAAAIAPLRAALATRYDIRGLEPPVHVAGRAAAAALLVELDDRDGPMRALQDRERAVRVAAALALVGAEPDLAPVRAIDVLLTALDEPDRARAGEILQTLGGVGRTLQEPLLELLRHEPHEEPGRLRRRRAAMLAGRLALEAAIAPLAALSEHADASLRLAALEALIAIPSAGPRHWAVFLADPELTIALRSLAALARCEHPERHGVPGVRQISRWLHEVPGGSSPRRRRWQPWRLWLAAWAHRPKPHPERL